MFYIKKENTDNLFISTQMLESILTQTCYGCLCFTNELKERKHTELWTRQVIE